jgi:hypothetical protein
MRALVVPLVLVGAFLAPMASAAEACSVNPFKVHCDSSSPAPTNERQLVYGEAASGHRSLGWSLDGSSVVPYNACFFAQLPVGGGLGQVVAAGLFNPLTAVDIRFEDFWAPPGEGHGGIALDTGLFQRPDPRWPLPPTHAQIAMWGNATFEVDFENYADPVNAPPPPADPRDEFQQEANWTAHFFLTQQGFRDNATKAIHSKNGGPYSPDRPADVRREKDWEAHLILRNHTMQGGQPYRTRYMLGPGEIPPRAQNYRASYLIFNRAYGGTAQLTFRLAGVRGVLPTVPDSRLTFEVFTPTERSLGNWTLGGTPTGTDSKVAKFPLDELMEYRVAVRGDLTLANYTITVEQTGPPEITLDFWWEDLVFGKDAARLSDDCRARVHGDLPVPPSLNVRVAQPKGLDLRLVALGIGASLVMGMFTVKLILDAVSLRLFLRGFRR